MFLSLFALLPVLWVLGAWSRRQRRFALAGMGSRAALEAMLAVRRWPSWLRGTCGGFGVIGLILGVAGPQWGREWGQSTAPGRDLVVVLDCSRSMYAETPSRLERAKNALLDLTRAMQNRGGHRLALVTFAGRAKVVCPLTHDYDHFRSTLEKIDTGPPDPDLGPGATEASGTRIGAGLRLAVEIHDDRFQGARDILLLSDGDDPARDGEWHDGISAAKSKGIPVYVAGIGDPDKPEPIYTSAGPLLYKDEKVFTHLEEAPLREIAESTHGLYFSAQTRTLPLGELYLDTIATLPQREESDDALPVYRQRYAWFFGPAFVLLALAAAISDRPRRSLDVAIPRPDVKTPVVENEHEEAAA
jgi:Ca-activated chloride channel family protein